jgi:hypothetical protein
MSTARERWAMLDLERLLLSRPESHGAATAAKFGCLLPVTQGAHRTTHTR